MEVGSETSGSPFEGSDSQARVLRALEFAKKAGSPVAGPDADFAAKTLRRLSSRGRRRWYGRQPHRQAMIEDLTQGYVDWYGGRAEVGSLVTDLRWLASVVCDFVFFMPPAGSSTNAPACRDEAIEREALSHLNDAAAAVGLALAVEADRGAARSFDSYQLGERGPLWVLLHRAAPIFAFACTPPVGFPLDPTMLVVDPPFDVGRLLSTDWRLLTEDQASQPVTEGRTIDLSREDLITSGRGPENVWQLLFTSKA